MIITEYTYTLEGEKNCFGSYIGRIRASRQTILRQWRKNDKLLGYSLPKKDLVILGSYPNHYISK